MNYKIRLREMNENILNFDNTSEDPAIFRIMNIERFIEILALKKICLRQPQAWDDPFENYLLKKGKATSQLSYSANIYGQCWSLHEETDAMWRIYAPDKMGVKVKTSINKLFSQFWHSEQTSPVSQGFACFIGKVNYIELKELKSHLGNNYRIKDDRSDDISVAQSLLIKRREFSHEAEVRLLYFEHNKGLGMSSFLKKMIPYFPDATFDFTIAPNALIEEVVIDPRMADHTCNAYTDYIRKMGYTGNIFQSSLYKYDL